MTRASKNTCVWVWLALLLLLLATLGFSRLNLHAFNTPLALLIAFVKMILVLLFFMEARCTRPMLWIFFCAGVLWLMIMIELTMSDYLTRSFSWSQ